MATPVENKTAGMTTEAAIAKVDTFSVYSQLSSQHLIFANLVKNRGGSIVHHETTISKSSCNRCAAHRRNSLTDLRALPTNSSSARHQDDNNNNNNHHHHPSCPSFKGQTASRSAISKQHSIKEPKHSVNARLPPKAVLSSETKHTVTHKQQPAIALLSSATIQQKEPQSRIPVRRSEATSSPSLSLINNQRILDKKKSMLPRPSTSHSSSLPKHRAATGDLLNCTTGNNNDEFLKSGLSNDSDQTPFFLLKHHDGDIGEGEEEKMKTPFLFNTSNCDWSLSDKQEKKHNRIATERQSKRIIVPPDFSNTITVQFRPTNVNYEVRIHQDMTVRNVIADVCRQANMHTQDDCYLWFNSRELNITDTVFQAGLYQTGNSTESLSEVRLKYPQLLLTSSHIGKQVFLTSPEQVNYNEILDIPFPSTKKHIIPDILKKVVEQIVQRGSLSINHHNNRLVLIPLPNFSKRSIDSLPTILLKLPLSPKQFDWNVLLEHLADDLEIDRTDLVVVVAKEGSTFLEIKLAPMLARGWETVKKVANKLLVMFLPKCEQFVDQHTRSNPTAVNKIQVELKNLAERKIEGDKSSLSLAEIDRALRLCERPAIIQDASWKFMIEKSRQISTCILQSIQSCTDEYIIDHASIVYNEQIYDIYQNLTNIDNNERILFHGTRTVNFDGIFEQNFQYNSEAKRTDKGWYGQGIYFSSSPKKGLNYAKSESEISYLICSLVRLGKTLTVSDKTYEGEPMHPDYDSHYVPIRSDGDPIAKGEIAAFEEFVIKRSDQIMPLYIVGMLKVSSFVIWRDAKITNEANSALFEEMKQRFAFNIYGTQNSVEAINILRLKLVNNECVVVTNGADDGEGFVRECRDIQSSLPIIVYCRNKTYHQQWTATLPEPTINVTSSPQEVFDYITRTLQK